MIKRTLYLAIMIGSLILSSCTFAYFNVFYNAEQYFKDAQAAPLRDNGKPSANAVQDYNNAIKKCGIILTDYKDSRWADDALFMLAQCLYYKGNSNTQAQEKFQDVINFYPESPFVADSWLYIARCLYQLNRKDEAIKTLKDFIEKPEFSDKHPDALLLIADFYVQERQYLLSERYLQKLLDEYKDSDQYSEAFFLLGRMHKEQGEYELSNQVYMELLDSRLDRRMKLDARYMIAENYIDLHEYEKALDIANRLMKDEYLSEKIAQAQLLQARAFAGINRHDEAIDLFERIIKDNARTTLAAAASYYMGEMYFRQLLDYDQAVEAYKQVSRHNRNSEYYELAKKREEIANEIKTFMNPEREVAMKDRFDEHLRLAEHYLYVLELPDSSLAVYNRLEHFETTIQLKLDTLAVQFDSLSTLDDSLVAARIDSLNLVRDALKDDSNMLMSEQLPFSKFVTVWIYLNIKNDPDGAQQVLDDMKARFPDNKYTYAAERMIAGDEIEITTLSEKQARAEYQAAIPLMESEPEITLNRMREIIDRYDNAVSRQAKFTTGYIYYFILDDSTSARPWFEDILEQDDEYSDYVRSFYQDSVFVRTDRLPYLIELEELEQQRLQAMQDSLLAADSLGVLQDSLLVSDPEHQHPRGPKPDDSDVDSVPRALIQEMPWYPPDMKEDGPSGAVVLNLLVLPDGSVGDIRVESSLMPSPNVFDEIAIHAAEKWIFTPARRNGEAVPYRMTIPVPFEKPKE